MSFRLALPALVLCLSAAAAEPVVIQPAPGQAATETRSVPLASGSTFRVENVNGRVNVQAWDKEELSFTGAFKPSSKGEQVKVVLKPTAKGLEVRCEYPKHEDDGSSYRGPKLDLDLKVPRSLLADLSSVNGDVTLAGTRGQASLTTVNGRVTAQDLPAGLKAESVNGGISVDRVAGALDLNTVNGDIEAKDLDGQGGGIKAQTVNGAVHFVLGAAKGHVSASSMNGGVSLHAAGAQEVEVKRHSASALLPGSGQAIEAETLNGGITIE